MIKENKSNSLIALKVLLPKLEKIVAKTFRKKQSQITAHWDGHEIKISINN